MRHGWFLPYEPTPNEYGSWKQHYIACVQSLDVELSGRTVATANTVSLPAFTIVYGVLSATHRAGVRHVRGVRPNRAADFRGPPILAFLFGVTLVVTPLYGIWWFMIF